MLGVSCREFFSPSITGSLSATMPLESQCECLTGLRRCSRAALDVKIYAEYAHLWLKI